MQVDPLRSAESLESAVLASWTVDLWLLSALVSVSLVYVLGWRRLRRRVPGSFRPRQLLCFLGGMVSLALAVSSPLDAFGTLSLSVHMTQHLLLMMIVPPLLWCGAPALPLMHGLPNAFVRDGLGPFLSAPSVQRMAGFLGLPLVCWLAFQLSTWVWHVPALYELALRSPFWHGAEHAIFLATGLMFWWPVVRPWPARRDGSPWLLVVYLISADLLNTVFSAIFTFADQVIYPTYALAPQMGSATALEDQARAGVIMWVPGSLIFLAPLATLIIRALDRAGERAREAAGRRQRALQVEALAVGAAARPVRGAPTRRMDLLRIPLLAWAGSRGARRVAQAVAFVVAAAVVVDGFLGPDLSPLNLAGVLPWTWARGLLVFGLVVFGAAFCWACPFTAPRGLAQRLLGARVEWPRALRSKWLAVGLIVLFLWAYEAWALWDRPAWTATLVCAYFAAAFVVDGLFRGAAFCKWVCPLGQFQFACSTVSPVEVAVRDEATCASCSTHDCLRGNDQQAGCALDLFLPEKRSSLDCTFCMDCVAACPHDNAGLLLGAPGVTLVEDPPRSSVGRLSLRPDLAVLALVLVWGGLLNAAVMVAPVQAALDGLIAGLDLSWSPAAVAGVMVLGALALLLGATWLVTGALACRLAWALLPLGFAMWLAHFALHFVTGWGAAVPATLRALGSWGLASPGGSGGPAGMAHAMSPPGALLTAQLVALNVGLLISLYVGWRVVDGAGHGAAEPSRPGRTLVRALPYALLATALWAADAWVLFQPMQMRGTMGPG